MADTQREESGSESEESYNSWEDLELEYESSEGGSSDDEEAEVIAIGGQPLYFHEPDAAEDEALVGERPGNRSKELWCLEPVNLNRWCQCTHCQLMPTETECFCCQSSDQVQNKMAEISERKGGHNVRCITHTDALVSICLNIWVLQVAWLQFRQQYGPKAFDGSEPARNRHVAYRQFVRWCWGFCGKTNRVTLPSCVVSCIRSHFPEADEERAVYRGYRLPPLEMIVLILMAFFVLCSC